MWLSGVARRIEMLWVKYEKFMNFLKKQLILSRSIYPHVTI